MFGENEIEQAFMIRGQLYVVLRNGAMYRFTGFNCWLQITYLPLPPEKP